MFLFNIFFTNCRDKGWSSSTWKRTSLPWCPRWCGLQPESVQQCSAGPATNQATNRCSCQACCMLRTTRMILVVQWQWHKCLVARVGKNVCLIIICATIMIDRSTLSRQNFWLSLTGSSDRNNLRTWPCYFHDIIQLLLVQMVNCVLNHLLVSWHVKLGSCASVETWRAWI